MAGEPEAQVTATGFPLPPPWFRLYKDGPESGPAPPRPVTDEFQVYDTAMNLVRTRHTVLQPCYSAAVLRSYRATLPADAVSTG